MIALRHPMPPFPSSRKSTNKQNTNRRHAKSGGSGRGSGRTQKASKGLVRIIGGKHRTRRLPVLVHEGLRPTGDRVKETLFNWLMTHTPDATCLDMYAGSGSLGIEALSRGAKHVCFIEQDVKVAAQIQSNINSLKETDNATILQASALQVNINDIAPFDLVFLDPPFGQGLIKKSLDYLFTHDLLSSNAKVYIEGSHDDEYIIPENMNLLKEIKTSQVLARLFSVSI
ncbi:16S rRNA (guanine(966)-N(2))-methyltransferase RsmD [Glaciecola petra]|uniref:Ribosomal RNA small subunit methyltransferase D n=1 Tax=Glaciecola petra TaxID=3075602 RepID=A0ABU2ZS43_9ALTE|nr:16S rRNA (guanine(966)-N(2))-methyltransferase RsmD [Aestuariibacter sp. P117]MDT0595453.1 16S rRNA (guanine(966)-N(2))-methyltransferase RsmD [Aestuariibacter sp. P117]